MTHKRFIIIFLQKGIQMVLPLYCLVIPSKLKSLLQAHKHWGMIEDVDQRLA